MHTDLSRPADELRADTTLDNGLRVIVERDTGAPVVALNLTYNVGSRHEEAGRTGLAHLFEHLMFQGSTNVAAGEHFQLMESVGADLNAMTSMEWTTYYEVVPKSALPLALWLEADRMAGLLDSVNLAALDNEREVVKNERRQSQDNVPYGNAMEELSAAMFPSGHPFHHLPIGSMRDLEAASLDDVRAFFRRHYVPANAVLTLVGDIELEEGLELAHRYFGPLTAGTAPPVLRTAAEGPCLSPARIVLDEPVAAPALMLGWRLPPDLTPETDAAELALKILAEGESSRLVSRLVRQDETVQAVESWVERIASADSMASLMVIAVPGADLAAVEAVIGEELDLLIHDGPTEDEVARAVAAAELSYLEQTADFGGRAMAMSISAVLHHDPDAAARYPARMRAVPIDGIRRAAGLLKAEHAIRVAYPAQTK